MLLELVEDLDVEICQLNQRDLIKNNGLLQLFLIDPKSVYLLPPPALTRIGLLLAAFLSSLVNLIICLVILSTMFKVFSRAVYSSPIGLTESRVKIILAVHVQGDDGVPPPQQKPHYTPRHSNNQFLIQNKHNGLC